MSLVERAQVISNEVLDLTNLKKRAEQGALFEKRANDLETPALELQQIEPPITVLLDLGISASTLDRPTIEAVQARVKDLRSRYLLDKSVIIDPFPKEDVRFVLYRALEQLPAKCSSALLEAWGKWGRRQLPKIDDEVLDLLEKIEALKPAVLTVKGLKQDAERICSSLPSSKEVVTQLSQLTTAIDETWHNLTGDGVPLQVLVFLRKAVGLDGAKLEDMTQEVLEWMNQHGLSNSLRVRIG